MRRDKFPVMIPVHPMVHLFDLAPGQENPVSFVFDLHPFGIHRYPFLFAAAAAAQYQRSEQVHSRRASQQFAPLMHFRFEVKQRQSHDKTKDADSKRRPQHVGPSDIDMKLPRVCSCFFHKRGVFACPSSVIACRQARSNNACHCWEHRPAAANPLTWALPGAHVPRPRAPEGEFRLSGRLGAGHNQRP